MATDEGYAKCATPEEHCRIVSAATLYDAAYSHRIEDLDFYEAEVRASERHSGFRVLEIGSGTGRVLTRLASRFPGTDFTGVEVDGQAADVAREGLRQRRLVNARIVQGDVLDVDLNEQWDLIVAPFRVLQHCLSLAQLEAVLARCRQLLRPSGRLIFDLFNPYIHALVDNRLESVENFGGETYTAIRTITVRSRDYFSQLQEMHDHYTVDWHDGCQSVSSSTFTTRYHFKGEVDLVLRDAGFRVTATYGSFDRRPYGTTPYPGELIYVAGQL